jgi:predicted O-linked N-acetylglucosamine transferase (SPINDLY family)
MQSADGPALPDLLQRAVTQHQAGQWDQAQAIYAEILRRAPDHADALHLSGVIAAQRGDAGRALELMSRALASNPMLIPGYVNRALALHELGQHDEALSSLARAIELQPDCADAHYQRGVILLKLSEPAAALVSFDAAIAARPALAEAFFQRGLALKQLRRPEAALASYDRAIALRPHYADAFCSRGNVLKDLWRLEEALASYNRAIALQPDLAIAYANRGNLQRDLMQYEAAAESYDAAVIRKAATRYLPGLSLFTRAHLCDWRNWPEERAALIAGIDDERPVAHPFSLLSIVDSAELQKRAAQIWAHAECQLRPVGASVRQPHHARIRIGYFSADFREHAVARLTAGIFEAHDRARFEVSGFSFGPDTRDPLRQRIARAFEHFMDVRDHSDAEVARLARTLELDIAVDLGGCTAGARPRVFAQRAAPLQVSYLGYPGTLGTDFMDYLIADAVIVPPHARRHYCEKIAALSSYQANDSQRLAAGAPLSREQLGLPRNAVVFCCFNANYKMNPDIFAAWMRILQRTAGSVLFLYAGNDGVAAHLRGEAARHGIGPARLVFGGRLPYREYLARYQAADLFLDTLPFNAGTTASDALWAGLPVLTCAGQAFAARIGASLLHAVGLPQLITTSLADYEERAVQLANDPAQRADIRERLLNSRLTTPLFDTSATVRDLESVYTRMYERYCLGLPPDHIESGTGEDRDGNPDQRPRREMSAPASRPPPQSPPGSTVGARSLK